MTRLDELVRGLSPNDVQYRSIGDIATVGTGSSDRKDAVENGKYPFYVRSKDVMRKDAFEFEEEAILIPGEGGVGDIFHYVKGRYALHQRAYRISFKLDDVMAKYAYYYLRANFKKFILARAVSATVTSIRKPMITDFKLAVPPLVVQREIVKVLDTFTDLEAELEAELEARRLQYAHYRDSLLALSQIGGVPRASLGEIATIVRGASPRPIQAFLTDAEDGIPWIKIGDVGSVDKFITKTAQRVTAAGAQKSRRVQPGDFVMSNSMSFGRPYISKIEGCIHDGWLSISNFAESFAPDFLYHLLRSKAVQSEFSRRASNGTVQNLNADIVKSVVVPVPPLAEQLRIASLLDNFDALVNDVTIGLPAELQARRQQYEYYRDKLLTFDEVAS